MLSRLNFIPTSKIPKWFLTIEQTTISNYTTRLITSQLQLSDINSLALSTGHFSKKSKPWLITYQDNNIILGKARRFNYTNNTIFITHWKTILDESITDLYPTPDIACLPCSGCELNSNRIPNLCTIEISATLSTKFLGRKTYLDPSNKLKLNANYLDLLYSIALRHLSSIPATPLVLIPHGSEYIFKPNISLTQLQNIAHTNLSVS